MRANLVPFALASLSLVAGRPVNSQLGRREVPQEHSHNQILATVRTSLNTNNPAKIQDPVFGLLGNAVSFDGNCTRTTTELTRPHQAAKQGAGGITDTDCLQQATADQAFTNAKAADDTTG